jgi:hypothetical protein
LVALKILSFFNGKHLQCIIKNGHLIDFKRLSYSILSIFFRFKNSKDIEVFLALKNGRINSKNKAFFELI